MNLKCDVCNKGIELDEPYGTVSFLIEELYTENGNIYAKVHQAESLLSTCSDCTDKYDIEKLKMVMKLLPHL